MADSLFQDIIDFLSQLARDENMSVTVYESAKGGLMAGGGAFIGGLLGGPIGMAAGAALGGCVAAGTCKDFEPVYSVIRKMNHHQRKQLAGNFRRVMDRHGVTTIAGVTALMAGGGHAIRQEAIAEITRYLTTELHHTIAR